MIRSRSCVRVVAQSDELSVFVPELVRRLARRTGAGVTVDLIEGTASGNSALGTLLALEKLVIRRGRPSWCDRATPESLAPLLAKSDTPQPEIVIDLTTAGLAPATATVLRPLYNGFGGEEALAGALFFEGTPEISISRRSTGADTHIVATGVASLEAAEGTGGAMEAVWSRVVELLVKAILLEGDLEPDLLPTPLPQPRPLRHTDVLQRSARMVASAAARAAYRLCCHAPHWRVGWRRAGPEADVWSRRDLGGISWNVMPDPGDHFYADPFPFFHGGRDYIFFEDLDHKTGKGIISVVEIAEDGTLGAAVPVLEEPWHLSYPFLMESDGEIWMVPEASLSGDVWIYRAVAFPWRWERHGALLNGLEAADATIVSHGGKFHMMAVVRDGVGGYSDTLSIWHADALLGPWRPHAANPVLIDDRTARPAGNFVVRDGKLLRPVQDCRNGYGAALSLARIDRLDESGFSQTIETDLAPDRFWPGRKIHTLNGNGRLETVDGSVIRPKAKSLAAIVERRYKP